MKRLVKGIKQPPPKWQQVESSRKIPFFIVHTWIAFVWLGIESRPNFKLECDIPCHCNVSCTKSIITKLCLVRFQILSLKYWCYVFLYFCQLFRVNENMDVVIIRHFNSELASNDHWPGSSGWCIQLTHDHNNHINQFCYCDQGMVSEFKQGPETTWTKFEFEQKTTYPDPIIFLRNCLLA